MNNKWLTSKVTDFIKQLDKLPLSCIEDHKKLCGGNWTVMYSTELDSSYSLKASKTPILRAVWYVQFMGKTVATWGCMDVEDSNKLAIWYMENKRRLQDLEYDQDRENEESGKRIFWR